MNHYEIREYLNNCYAEQHIIHHDIIKNTLRHYVLKSDVVVLPK